VRARMIEHPPQWADMDVHRKIVRRTCRSHEVMTSLLRMLFVVLLNKISLFCEASVADCILYRFLSLKKRRILLIRFTRINR